MTDIQIFIKREFTLLFILLVFLIDPYFRGYYMCYILAFYFLTLKLNFFITYLDKKGILLFCFSISYSIIYSLNLKEVTVFTAVYAISPVIFYIIGKYFLTKYSSYKIYYFLFLFLTLGYSLIPAISIINHIIKDGFTGDRNLSLLWSNHEVIAATILGSYFTMNMAFLGTLFVQKTTSFENKIKLISFGAFIISLLCILRVASRTQLGIALISLLVTLIYIVFKRSFRRSIRLLLTVVIIIFVIFYNISMNSVYFNIINERDNDTEILMNANGRTERWSMSIKNLIEKPFGWSDSSTLSHAHNLWLDVARISGIIPFIFLCLFTISCIYLIKKALKISPLNNYFNTTLLVLFTGFMTIFFVEPVIEGMYLLFLIFCFFIGILSGYVKSWYI